MEDKQTIAPSNILYCGSHIVKGQGLAIACAVGCRTQKGMAEGSFKDIDLHIIDQ